MTIALRVRALVALSLLAACSASFQPRPEARAGDGVVFSRESPFGMVYVVDVGDRRALRFDRPDGDNQSEISLSDPLAVPIEFVRLAAAAIAHTGAPRRVMMIGLGGGNFSTMLWRAFPDTVIEVVEINPVVVEAAVELFGVPRDDPRYRVAVGDGLEFARGRKGPYDIIFVDAYDGTDIPAHLATRDFFALLGERLADGGVVVLNVAVPDEDEPALVGEFRAVFDQPACYRAVVDDNLIVIGAKGPPASREETAEAARRLQTEYDIPIDLGGELAKRVSCDRIGPGH